MQILVTKNTKFIMESLSKTVTIAETLKKMRVNCDGGEDHLRLSYVCLDKACVGYLEGLCEVCEEDNSHKIPKEKNHNIAILKTELKGLLE